MGLDLEACVVAGGGLAGLRGERRFRLSWWTSGEEPVRAALQRLKTSVYRRAADGRAVALLTEAWRGAEQAVYSEQWRQHLRQLTRGYGTPDDAYLRLAFRAAQQAWSRARRWESVMPGDEPSPFAPLLDLFSVGAWPVGCFGGKVWVFLWEKDSDDGGEFGPPFSPPGLPVARDFVFLSARFRDSIPVARLETLMRAVGWKVVHGPVSEDAAAPEVQLGARIRESRAVVGLCDAADEDFGLPWWMFQELDYACACGLPVFLASRHGDAGAEWGRTQELYGVAAGQTARDHDPELRRWLEANAAHLWR